MSRFMTWSILGLSLALGWGCGSESTGEPSESVRSAASGTSPWVRCKKSKCTLYLTSDLSARVPGTAGAASSWSAGDPWLKQDVLSVLPHQATKGQEQGVWLIKGNYALVSWLDPFYTMKVQIALLNTGEWELFTKPEPMGTPPSAAPANQPHIYCWKPDGCWVYATKSLGNFSATDKLGAQSCRASMAIVLIDSDSKRAIVSYPMADRSNTVQVVKYGDWKELGSFPGTWAMPEEPPLGYCLQDQALSAEDRCTMSGGTWDDGSCPTTCPPPACGQPLPYGCNASACGAPSCKCPGTAPFWDESKGCLSGYCADFNPSGTSGTTSVINLCTYTGCSPAVTCEQGGGTCGEFAWPSITLQCPAGYSPVSSLGTCTPDSQGRSRACCAPTSGLCPKQTKANWQPCAVDCECKSSWCGSNGGSAKVCLPGTNYPK